MNAKPSKTQLAYIAGYVDGEGSIAWYNSAVLSLESCHPEPIRFIQGIYGGTIRSRKRSQKPHSHRTSYYIRYFGGNCLYILNQIFPYLIEKKEQAESILEVKRLREKLKAEKRIDHGPLLKQKTQLAKK